MIIEKIKRNKTLVKGGLFSFYSFLGKGVNFILLLILANYIAPSEYGELSLFTTVVTFLSFFMGLSTSGYFSISYFRKSNDEFKKDFSTIFTINIICFLAFIILISLGSFWIVGILKLSESLLYYAIIISFFQVVFHLHQDYYRIKEKIGLYGLFNCGNAILNFIFSLIFVICLDQNWLGRVNSQILCTVSFGAISLLFFFKGRFFDFDINRRRFKTILFWGIPLIPHLCASWIRQGLDQYIINYNYSTYEVGLFSFALNLASIIIMVGNAFNATNSVTIYKTLSDNNERDKKGVLRKESMNILKIYIIASAMIGLSVPILVYTVMPRYVASIPYFYILFVYGFIQCLYFLFSNYMFYYGKTKELMVITFSTSILHLCLSLLLTPYSLYLTACVYVVIQSVILFFVIIKVRNLLISEGVL